MRTRISGSGRAAGRTVTSFSTSARTATAGIAIAAWSAAGKPAFSSGDAPMGGINGVKKGASIIATGTF